MLLTDGGDVRLSEDCTGNGIQDVPCLFSGGGDIASNSGKVPGALQSAKAARYFEADFDHPDILFSKIIGKGNVLFMEKSEHR